MNSRFSERELKIFKEVAAKAAQKIAQELQYPEQLAQVMFILNQIFLFSTIHKLNSKLLFFLEIHFLVFSIWRLKIFFNRSINFDFNI